MPRKRKTASSRKTVGGRRRKARATGPVLGRVRSLKDAVQAAIDNGATTVQEVHQRIAAMPF
jgi:hypothetical protein